MFNLQSGLHRQRFPARLTQFQAKQLRLQELRAEDEFEDEVDPADKQKYKRGQGKHTDAVRGIAVDNLNREVITCSSDGTVKVCNPSFTGFGFPY
jgi:U3 small nucleolar RNA-associated protein 21